MHVTGWSQPCVVSPQGFFGGLLAWYGLRRARPLVPVAAGDNSIWSWSSVVTLFNGFVGVGTSQVSYRNRIRVGANRHLRVRGRTATITRDDPTGP